MQSKLAKNGEFLGLVDVCLLCFERGYNVSFFIHDLDPHPKCVDGFEVIANSVGAEGLEDLVKVPESNKRLLFVFCRADYKPAPMQTLNHFMPAFSMDALGPETFELRWHSALSDIAEEMVKIQTEMSDALNVWPISINFNQFHSIS